MPNEERNSFIRWQSRAIQQLSFVNNLLLGLATGLLAFQTQLAFDDKISFTVFEKWLLIVALIFIFSSLAVGCYVAWNRLLSFRTSAQVARKREIDERDGIEELRKLSSALDKRTWRFLWWQTVLFTLGGLLLFLTSVLRYLS